MDAVNLIGSPKASTSNEKDWEISHVAEIVFDACDSGKGTVNSADVVSYVQENWVHKDSDLKQADEQLQRLLLYLTPDARSEGLDFREFQERFTNWVESEQSKDLPGRTQKMETYETEFDDNGTIASSTTESLLSWDYPPCNGFDYISLKKENQTLKEQISSAELYNNDLVLEVQSLQSQLKNVSDTKSDLHIEVDDRNTEISSLRQEINDWRDAAEQYKEKWKCLEAKLKQLGLNRENMRYSNAASFDMDVPKEDHDQQILTCNKTIMELTQRIAFLKKDNEMLEDQVEELKLDKQYSGMNGDSMSLRDELADEAYRQAASLSQEYFVTEEEILLLLSLEEEERAAPLLSSFIPPNSLDDFSNLVTSVARQLSRVLKSLPLNMSNDLVPKAERQLFTDTLHQMASSKHLSEIKIAQLVDLFKRLKVDHRKLSDKHECLQADYQTLLMECKEMRDEIVSLTRAKEQLRNEVVAVYDASQLTPPSTPETSMQRPREDRGIKAEIDDLKKKLKGAEKANLTLTLAIEEQTKQRNALQGNIDELQRELSNSVDTISRIEYDNKTLTRDNEKLAETYTRQRGDLDELRKEWVSEMDRCTTIESGYNSLNQTIVSSLRSVLALLNPSLVLPHFDPLTCLPLEEWSELLNKEFLEATRVAEEVRLNSANPSKDSSGMTVVKKSVEVQTVPTVELSAATDMSNKGNLARAACFEETISRSSSDCGSQPQNGTLKPPKPSTPAPSLSTLAAGIVDAELEKDDISTEYQFTTDVATLSRKSIEGEFQAITLSFENDTFTLQKRLTMHDRAFQKASANFQSELDSIKTMISTIKADYLPEDKRTQLETLSKQLDLLPETMETLTGSSLATGRCQQEDKHVRCFEIMVAHNFHTKKQLTAALAACSQTVDAGIPKKDVDRAAVRKKTLAVAAAMRKDEEKQKQMQASESSSVFSSFAGVVKNLMVKTPAEPDLANRRATEMMQRMKTVETLGADKEALYKEGYRGGLSSGLHDSFDKIKKEQQSCDENVDALNKRASKLEREVAFYKKHSNHLFYGGAATPAATLRTIFCTVFINLFVLFVLLITVPLPEHSGYTLGTGYISLQEFITSQFLNVPDRNKPLL